jgi:hypothetical protein
MQLLLGFAPRVAPERQFQQNVTLHFFQLEIYLILHQILQLVESARNFFDFDRDQREDFA